MSNQPPAIILALAMLTVTVPMATANHLSVGVHDAVGNAPEEDADAPSVPGDRGDLGTNDSAYGIGTTHPDACYEAEAEASTEEARAAVESHGFCGLLYYNEDTGFEQTGPPDQAYLDDFVGTFDVQRTWWFGYFPLTACEPWCQSYAGEDVPGDALWRAAHTVGSAAGLTDDPDTADEEEGEDRDQTYYVKVDLAHAPGLVQRELGVWEMDGWTVPAPFERFVGFLQDSDGDTITDDELADHITQLVDDGELSTDTTPQVCGYVPQRTFVSTGEQSFCDTPLLYRSADDSKSAYDDECQATTYVCGPTVGAYWGSESVGLTGAYGDTQDHYLAWHWVIAPNQPDCAFTAPGFDLDGDGTGQPYLAHDLDVYTPPTALSNPGPVANPDATQDYVFAHYDEITDALPSIPDATDTEEVYAFAEDNTPYVKDDVLEPNHVDAATGEPVGVAIDDDSRQAEVVERSLDLSDCEALIADETADTVDPWVNIVDASVDSTRSVSVYSGYTGLSADPPTAGLYESEDESHDEDNDPTTDTYATSGFVGMFTDKDDDGEYEQITGSSDSADTFSPEVWQAGSIFNNGAYPMAWDMHVEVDEETDEAQVDREGGCTFSGDQSFAAVMEDAGYGPNTGLAQAIFLKEPTVFEDLDTDDPTFQAYPGGDNIYVLANQAVRALWSGDLAATEAHPLGYAVDTLVGELQAYVTSTYDVDAEDISVVQPGEDLGLDGDYGSQCNQSTGGFASDLAFSHACETDCSGDTIATMYAFETTRDDGTIGGGEVPYFSVNDEDHDFGTGLQTWYDLDAFDGNEDRNEERMDPPPTGDE